MELFLKICSILGKILIVMVPLVILATVLTNAICYFAGAKDSIFSFLCAIIVGVALIVFIIMGVIGIWHCHSNGITLIEMLRN